MSSIVAGIGLGIGFAIIAVTGHLAANQLLGPEEVS